MGILTINNADLTSEVCDSEVSFASAVGAGVYYVDVELGPNLGIVNLNYTPGNIPDRYEIFYDGNLVADSKFVGDYLSGNPPDADTALWESGGGTGQFVGHAYNSIPDLVWDGVSFVPSGPTTNFTILQSDIANLGETASGGNISFNKTSNLVNKITVKVTSVVSNTGWGFEVGCPQ